MCVCAEQLLFSGCYGYTESEDSQHNKAGVIVTVSVGTKRGGGGGGGGGRKYNHGSTQNYVCIGILLNRNRVTHILLG